MIHIDGNHLTIQDVADVAKKFSPVMISERGRNQITESHERLERLMQLNRPIYGINTGFGIFSDQKISLEDSAKLSRNLILSHAVATGPDFPTDIVRAAMLIRSNTLTKGFSGVRMQVVQTLVDMLNEHVHPCVPSQGSLGSSGDLCLLSHLALVFTTDSTGSVNDSGLAEYEGRVQPGASAMRQAGLERIVLGAKEGLALNNGATFSTALGALACFDCEYLLKLSSAILALSLEALLGCSPAFDDRIHEARGMNGQITVARQVRELTRGSAFLDRSDKIQDAYSLRCAPQVQGGVLDTLGFVKSIIEKEINAATDNPLVFDSDEVISGGNFHGEPIGLAMDYLGIAATELGAISERRTFRLLDARLNGGLPPMLVDQPRDAGLNSGLMMPHYTAASLALENQTLAHPDSVHSLPTSGDQEDHNANSATAARNTTRILKNVTRILSIELYTACRAIDLRRKLLPGINLGQGTSKVYEQVRTIIPYQTGDILWGPEIDRLEKAIISKEIEVPEV